MSALQAATAAYALRLRGTGHVLNHSGVLGLFSNAASERPGSLQSSADDDAPSTSGRGVPPIPPFLTSFRRHMSIEAPGGSAPPAGNWIMRNLPPRLVPYAQLMRLDKPIGTWLLALPCFWSIALATPPGHLPDLWMMALFGSGAVLLRGAGCTVNDLWDRDLDSKVERTRSRPLAAGTLTPRDAIGLLALQLSLGLVILLQLNDYSKLLGASSLLLVGTYPLMKRITYWPQAFLGLTINWGAMMGYSAVAGACDWSVVLPLYGAGVAWTLVYDTIYAHQDKRDDVAAGVKSTALLFGERSKAWFAGFGAATVACLLAAGGAAGVGVPYYVGVGAMAGHLAWQVTTVDLSNGPDCMAKFVSNKWAGGLLLAGIVADRLLLAAA
ncbi:Palmitoyl-protein thioesterase 1 [Pleodorina starrii]|uniref:4-hydroxybenzoate polyprenyltransferase, mitochondrial n=1 Tax=Pleodorina starrii TaxID=330485 RepID=A0A9W6BQV0_9CHLO|nr:Palmitoyl-protein thioesterase 1 [Pleodorina starrii]GLC56240.1 Palmitoyl-protein thioesterase 1 [Pleodorina starrii]GLC69126.1 Palmitoyl-protein thioesterase 1 [Pleodorina starrii]